VRTRRRKTRKVLPVSEQVYNEAKEQNDLKKRGYTQEDYDEMKSFLHGCWHKYLECPKDYDEMDSIFSQCWRKYLEVPQELDAYMNMAKLAPSLQII
jgi:hypothetical protein